MSLRRLVVASSLVVGTIGLTLSSLGVRDCSKVRIREAPIRGIEATTEIGKKEVVCRVERKDSLEVSDLASEKAVFGSQEAWRKLPWESRLAALLLTTDKKSWKDSLPKDFDLPIFWSREDFVYQPLASAVAAEKRRFDALCGVLTEKGGYGEEEARWALCCVLTRSFSGPAEATSPKNRLFLGLFVIWLALGSVAFGGSWENAFQGAACAGLAAVVSDLAASFQFKDVRRHVLAPGLDLLNHKCDASEVSYEYFKDAFALCVEDKIDKGREVFASYGKKTNAELLLNYGFVEENNVHDTYIFPDGGNRRVSYDELSPRVSPEECRREAERLRSLESSNPLLSQLTHEHVSLLLRHSN